MEPEVGDLLDDALVDSPSAATRDLDALLADLARARGDAFVEQRRRRTSPRAAPSRARRPCARATARSTRRSPCGTRARSAARARAARRRRSRRAAPRRRACCRTSRPCARAAAASGSRTTPRRSRASAARPRRPSTRASARGRSPRPGRSRRAAQAASRSGTPRSRSSSRRRASRAGSSWRIDASSAACATPSASATCRALPAPPEAMTGTRHGVGDRARELEVVAGARPVGVDRREQDLAGAARLALARPLGRAARRRASCRRASARRRSVASIATTTAWLPSRSASSVTSSGRSSAAVLTETLSAPARSSASASATLRTPPPTVNGIASRSATRATSVDERAALLERRRDVEEHELVGARVGVRAAELDRVADVAQPVEVDALDDAAARDVEARDQTRERHSDSRKRAPAAPLFSGWNCTPMNDAALARRRRCLPTSRSRTASRPRTSARSRTPRRPARPPPSRCAGRAPRAGAPRGPGRCRGRRRRRPPRTRRARAAGRGRCRAPAGPPSTRSRSASSSPRSRRPVHRARAEPTPGSTARSALATSSRDSVGAEPRERERDRADVAGAVVADRDVHSDALRRRDAVALGAHGRAQRAADRLERGLGDVVRRRGRSPRRGSRAAPPARGSPSTCAASPGSRSSVSSAAGRPPRSTAARASASSIGTTASP